MSEELKKRFKNFGIRVLKMAKSIKGGLIEDILIRQIVRSATAVGANYYSALRGRSKAEFLSKVNISEEEADECCYWLEIMIEIGIFPRVMLEPLLKEGKEITAILTATRKTTKLKMADLRTK